MILQTNFMLDLKIACGQDQKNLALLVWSMELTQRQRSRVPNRKHMWESKTKVNRNQHCSKIASSL